MMVFLSIFCVVLVSIIVIMSIVLLKLSRFIFDLEDSIEESLDVLDQRYKRINEVLQVPVASDDPMIRMIVSEIKLAREAILLVANKLVSFTLTRERDEEEENA